MPRGSAPPASDEALLDAVAGGDEDAFSQLFDRMSGSVYGVVRQVLRDPARAEEVAQEVFLEVWRSAARFERARGKAGTWVMVMAHRRAIDRVRYEQTSRDRDARVALRDRAIPVDSVVEAVQTKLQAEHMRRAMTALTPLQRQPIVLAYFDGHTYRDVAVLLDVPLGTVKTRIRNGLRRLGTVTTLDD